MSDPLNLSSRDVERLYSAVFGNGREGILSKLDRVISAAETNKDILDAVRTEQRQAAEELHRKDREIVRELGVIESFHKDVIPDVAAAKSLMKRAIAHFDDADRHNERRHVLFGLVSTTTAKLTVNTIQAVLTAGVLGWLVIYGPDLFHAMRGLK